jgi:predicted outer membrane repeat protein
MRHSLLAYFILLLTVSVNASSIQVSGNVSGNWDTDTVQVVGNLFVPSNQSLVIHPGVKVIFDGYYYFEVAGQINAIGLINDSISFFVADTLGLSSLESNKGSWAGFWFEPGSTINDSSTFEFCKFNYGKAVSQDSVYWYGGAIFIKKYHKLRFSNCSFSNNIAYKNGGAIYCRESNIKVENCDFIDNKAGTADDYGYGGALCLEYSDAKVYRNYFTRNASTGVGGGLSFEYSNPDIDANIFDDNYSAIGGGLCCLRSEQGNSIANNLIVNNESMFFGGGVAFLEAHPLFINNTVVDNFSVYAGGLYIYTGAMPIIKNCIIWNNSISSENGPQVTIFDVYSAPEFYYNNIQGGFEDFGGSGIGNFLGVYEDNIDLDPRFIGAGAFPLSLKEDSPCVNSGTPDTTGLLLPAKDLAGNERFIENRIDMGCYENLRNSGSHNLIIDHIEFKVSPNPATDHSIINLKIREPLSLEMSLLDIQGKLILAIPMQDFTICNHQIKLSTGQLDSGLYLLKFMEKHSKQTETLRLVVQ